MTARLLELSRMCVDPFEVTFSGGSHRRFFHGMEVEIRMSLSGDVAEALALAMLTAQSDRPGPSSLNGITREINRLGEEMAGLLGISVS